MGLRNRSRPARLLACRRPEAHGIHAAESTRIAVSLLLWPPRVAHALRDRRGGSTACGRPRDVGPRCERWRALERDRDAAFEPPFLCDDASLSPDPGRRPSIVWGGRLCPLVVQSDREFGCCGF